MTDSTFNPDTFLSTETEQANETTYEPIPEGDYQALVEDVTARNPKGMSILDVTYELVNLEEDLKQKLGRGDDNKVTVRQSIFLDIENGTLATGPNKNVKLGKLREALGQNQSGKPWSPLMMKGCGPLLIKVTQRPDDKDPEVIYNDVVRVTKAA